MVILNTSNLPETTVGLNAHGIPQFLYSKRLFVKGTNAIISSVRVFLLRTVLKNPQFKFMFSLWLINFFIR